MMKTLTRYVHVTSRDRPGLVEFNFSINDPTLYLEMILPVRAFEDFCQSNQVMFLTDEQAEAVAKQQEKWRYGEDDNVYMTDDN
jgi:phenol hydroxylase P0 protein